MKNKILRLKKVLITMLVLLFCAIGTTKGFAQSTMGTDFWVTFLPNSYDENSLSLIAAGPRACTGTVVNPYTNWSTSFNVSVGTTTNINIPKSQAYDFHGSDCILNTALHIISTDTISLYASNFQTYTFDITDVLPTESLGSEYVIQSYPPTSKGTAFSIAHDVDNKESGDHSEFAIVATENNTQISITLNCNSENGHYANHPFSITLNAGQCYQVKSEANGDLNGSQILVANEKKVAVFAGNLCANIPSADYCCCDHIVEQLMPVTCWGKEFVVTNSQMRSNDIVCITSSRDNCKVWKDGTYLTTINANRTHQFMLSSSTPAIYLETSEPVQVYLYFTGSTYGGSNGDPSMVIINPIEQKIDNVTFSTFNSGTSRYHFVNIAIDSDKTSSMRLDGNNISSQFQTVTGNPDYSYARVQVNHGSHTLSNTNGGFVAHVYGLGTDESYSYSVGSMARNLTSQLLVDGQVASDHPNGFDICGNEPITFNLNLNFDFSHVHWDFGDGNEGNTCPVSHTYEQSGIYPVSCNVYCEIDGIDSLVSTLTTTLNINEAYLLHLFASGCDSYTWSGHTFTQSTDHEYAGTTINGCDSIEILHLTINPTEITHETSVACDAFEWKGTVYSESGTYEHFEGQTIYGCDSIAMLDLTINKTPQIEILGYTQVAYSSNQWPGIYHYYVVDSTTLEPGTITWSCSNPDWIFVPISDFHCKIIAKSQGMSNLSVITSTNSGCDTSASIEINATNFGVNDGGSSPILLFPNPAQTEITVSAQELTRISLHNALGQTVMELSLERTDTAIISIEDLPQGFYIVEITTVFGKTAKQLVISR